MPLTLQDLALDGSFAGVARRLAAGEDPTVVEPRYAHLWIDPARYPTAITLVTPPSLDATGLMIVPFLDGIGEPGDEAFNLYAGVVYILDVHGVVLRSREYQDAPGEASLLTYAPGGAGGARTARSGRCARPSPTTTRRSGSRCGS
jgi:hypothetical protein